MHENKTNDHIRGMGDGRLIEMVDKGFRVFTLSSVYFIERLFIDIYFFECLFIKCLLYRDGV